jgi:hypothetical protein
MSKFALIVVCWAALAASPTRAQDKEPLRGLAQASVNVTVTADDAGRAGLSEGVLKELLGARLRAVGIRVVEADERAPKLNLFINAQRYAPEGLYAIAVNLDLYQRVRLERGSAPPFHASTWRVTQVFLRGADDLGSVRAVAERAADEFVKDFLSVNPPQH